MARLLYACLFIQQIRQWYLTWKDVLSISNYFYQHQNITIIIKGESETCPISEIAVIILSLKFLGSFEADTFPFTNLFFPPSRFSLLPSDRSLSCLPPSCSNSFKKKTSSQKSYLRFKRNAKHYTGWLKITRVVLIGSVIWEPSWQCLWAGKFFQRWFLETIFSPEGDTLKSYKSNWR